MPDIEVEPGVRIHAQTVGTGPPVVLLHGWAFDHRIWDRQIRVLAEAGYATVAIDLRGHGRSDRPYGDYTLERLSRDVITVITKLGLTDAALVGWSLGGVTAFKVAVEAPQLLSRLVLVGSNGVATSRQTGYEFGYPASAHLPSLRVAELADRLAARRSLIRGAFADVPADATVEYLLGQTLDTPSWAGAATLATLLNADLVAEVDGMTVKTVQIIGEKDPVFSRRGAAWLAERLPQLGQVVLPGCGHYPMIEAPDAFDDALLSAVRGAAPANRSD
ncbi:MULTISPECIES: alpha/beta fold hydrolase [Rhodococcus]|uniref:Alpha/beta hydrolase n=1 Tax=Rhodococcus opacus TaxID=37919 RepID=A0AAX3Y9E0_RHOOP|nr:MULTISPECIES: alpha/beta hydrolase [Rhodococcus]NHU41772.1 alpha/beta hydrolase [Rhodococcus sp. A14]MCZ4586326.1 alpha/beta hydrolase [Rhodococcus opacus]MDI9940484.1 alpha/beta hydrolase [Rhodococcus sp. IEGM 1351]QZS57009.1 alpha/beta hydrolase [Rhodococcus opacus]RKM76368.1 alpha/beta hydrolase [Rhodococcus opacus]